MKTKFLSMTAGAANNDPLVFYAIALLIFGALIGWPWFIKFIITKIREARKSHEKGNEGLHLGK